jgi:hypothetical protein
MRNLAPGPFALRGSLLVGTMREFQKCGNRHMRALNERKIPTQRGLRWHVSSVSNLLVRAQKLEAVR